jgi:hypothetical protein
MASIYIGMLEHNQFHENPKIYLGRIGDFNRQLHWLNLMTKNQSNIIDIDSFLSNKKENEMICFKKIMIGSPFGHTRSSPNNLFSRNRCG